jgi:hypothetical protein
MKSNFHKQVLVFVMLLSFIGQVFATTSICTMATDKVVSTGTSGMASAPCHEMMMDTQLDNSGISSDSNGTCCDDESMAISHDCACPDGGCAASITFGTISSTSSLVASELAIRFASSSFISQTSAALFRPPIV